MGPRRTWEGLSWNEQRQVLRAARRGNEHADPAIADAAFRWAQQRIAPSNAVREGIVGLALSAIDSALGGGHLGMSFAERRAAKRILAAGQRARAGVD